MSDADVTFEVRGRAGFITLDRQQALNAVSFDMIQAISTHLDQWERDPGVERVAIKAAPGRAYSAGGDLRALYDWRSASDPRLIEFYRHEYRLNRRIKTYPKPYIALIDGIAMGGGVGVSFHGSHRIVTENVVFAMPETGIGFFPDVGATWFLARCPGRIGEYLSLSGARLGPADVVYAGLATHHINSSLLGQIETEIAEADDFETRLASLVTEPGDSELAGHRASIDRTFSAQTVELILATLDRWPNDTDQPWAMKTAETIREKSPLSQKIALRQIREGRALNFDACMALEFRLVSRFVADHDFFEGIRAIVIDKDKQPCWRPARLSEVGDELIAKYFSPIDDELVFRD